VFEGAVNYKYRMHDARIGRFMSIDPLTSDFAWNSPYVFSENRLIDAVELEGLEAIMIHGTFADQETWHSDFAKDMLKATNWNTSQSNMYYGNWSGDNNSEAREAAASSFFQWAVSDANPQKKKKHVTLISHSHGGNVAKLVKNKLEALNDGWVVDIINISVPQRDDFQANTSGDEVFLNFYSNSDLVQYIGTSDYGVVEQNEGPLGARKDPKADKNIELDSWTEYGNQAAKSTIVAPFAWILEAAANSVNWALIEGVGHSEHADKDIQKQILNETTTAFKGKKP
jgi:hypothetical protein